MKVYGQIPNKHKARFDPIMYSTKDKLHSDMLQTSFNTSILQICKRYVYFNRWDSTPIYPIQKYTIRSNEVIYCPLRLNRMKLA